MLKTRLLLIGGGHAHVEVLRQLISSPRPDGEVVLVSPDRFTPYSGMLPGWIAGHYSFTDCHIDLASLTRRARVHFIQSSVQVLAANTCSARLADGSTVAFDVAGIDIGSVPPQGVPGAAEHAWAVKPVATLIERLETLRDRVASGAVRSIVAVGGGAAGVEVLLAIRHRLQSMLPDAPLRYAVVADTPTILPQHNAWARRRFEQIYRKRGIAIHAGIAARAVTNEGVERADGTLIGADVVIWATGASAAPWVAASGLTCDARGFMTIDATLRSSSDPRYFGSGDIATIAGARYPKSGVYAVRQGPVLAHNLRATLDSAPLQTYRPQPQSLALISTGDRYAVAARGAWSLGGRWVWHWKDRIDRQFMARYADG